MKKGLHKLILIIIAISITFLSISCATGRALKTEEIKAQAISGTFTVITYGARFSGDLENIVILDIEDDKYNFEVFAPEFDYKIKKNVSAPDAIIMAESFIAFHGAFKHSQVSQVKDLDGRVIGYEFRPLYHPSEFGFFDVLDIHYWLDGNKVKVRIDLIPEIKKRLFIDETFQSDSQ